MAEPILSIRDLVVEFRTDDGVVHAVDGVSYDVYPGETLGIVGESGSGKSVSMLSVFGLIPQPPGRIASGEAVFKGRNLMRISKEELALKVKEYVPGFYIHFAPIGEDPDKRNYLVSNQRLREAGFEARRTLDDGIQELLKGYRMEGRALFKSRVTAEIYQLNLYDRAIIDVMIKSKGHVKSKIW